MPKGLKQKLNRNLFYALPKASSIVTGNKMYMLLALMMILLKWGLFPSADEDDGMVMVEEIDCSDLDYLMLNYEQQPVDEGEIVVYDHGEDENSSA